VPSLSTAETLVYVEPSSGQAIITHRGTATAGDVWTDARLATGDLRRTARYRRASRDVDRAVAQLDGYSVTQTGHSLGASLARETSAHPGINRTARTDLRRGERERRPRGDITNSGRVRFFRQRDQDRGARGEVFVGFPMT